MRVDERPARHAHRLEHERHGVDAEAGQALLEPEPDHLRDLVADLRVGDVEVRLVGVEAVQVVLAGLLVPGPVGVLLVGEDDVAGLLRRLLVGPDVEVAVGRVGVRARRLEPRVLVGGVVHHEVGDHADAAVARGADHLHEVAVGPQPRVDAVEVDDVVAVVAVARRRIERHEPQAADAEPRQVVDPLGQPGQVAAAVAVGVEEGLDVEAVDDRVLPPQVAGRLDSSSQRREHVLAEGVDERVERPGRRGAGRSRRSRGAASSCSHAVCCARSDGHEHLRADVLGRDEARGAVELLDGLEVPADRRLEDVRAPLIVRDVAAPPPRSAPTTGGPAGRGLPSPPPSRKAARIRSSCSRGALTVASPSAHSSRPSARSRR